MLRTLPWENERIRFQLQGLIRGAGCVAAMFFMMRAELLLRSAPMAIAMMAAGLNANQSATALAAGCLLGMLRLPISDISLLPAIGCTLALGMELILSLLPRLPRRLQFTDETHVSAVAGLCALLPTMLWAKGEAMPSLQALICGLLAAAAAPFFLAALKAEADHLSSPSRTGLALMAGACLAGLWQITPIPAEIIAALAVLVIPHPAVGTLAGIALCAGGAPLLKTASLALCSLAAGRRFLQHRWQKSLAICIAAAMAQILAPEAALDARWALCAAAIYPLLPQALQGKIGALFLAEGKNRCSPEQLSQELNRETRRRLTALSDAFSIMAEGCAAAGDVPDEQELIQRMRSRLCAGCSGYESCWAGADNRGVRLLCSLISDALDRVDAPPGMRTLFSDGDVPPDILRICRRGRMIPDRLGLLMRDFAEKRRSEIKRCQTDQLLSVQLMQAREILLELAQAQSAPFRSDRVQAALDGAGIGACESICCGDRIHLLREQRSWRSDEVHRAASAIRRSIGGRFLPKLDGESLCFVRAPRLRADTGACCQSGVAGELCGDSHLVRMLGDSRLMLVISDGMGSGAAACAESTEALRLLWRFLDAGISRPLALETINRQLLARTGEDMFATMDLCLIDLNSGIAEFTKMAACRSIILRGSECTRVEGAQLPLGILENVQPSISRIRLRPDDLLVMGSDGVMETKDALLIERALRTSHASPQQLAEQLVRESALQPASDRPDDRTCICARIQSA